MGVYRRKDKDGKAYGPYIVQFPQIRDPRTGKIVYATVTVGFSKQEANVLLAEKMLEWESKKKRGIETRRDFTFGELVDWYLELVSTQSLRSYTKIRQHGRTLKAHFGNILAKDIKPYMVENYQQERRSKKSIRGTRYRPASINREYEVLKRIFNMAIREEFLDKNPCFKVPRLSEENARNRVLSSSELEKLIGELPTHAADIVRMGYFTGMRFGEIVGLTWDRVDLASGTITLNPEDTKTGKARVVALVSEAVEILRNSWRVRSLACPYVFSYKGQAIKSIKTALWRAMEKAGIEDFRFHDLRHTFNTNMRRAGVEEVVTMKLTGHRTMSMYSRYSTVDLEDAKEAMAKFETYLGFGSRTTAISTAGNKKG